MKVIRVVEEVGRYLYEYYLDENKNKQGVLKKFNSDKILCEELEYKDDMLDGVCYYYEDGKLISKLTYKKNRLDGESLSYYLNGEIKSESFFIDGKQEGECKNYSCEGVLLSVTNYKNSKLHGEKRKYYENGQLEMVGYYENNSMVGVWKWYDIHGELIKESNKN